MPSPVQESFADMQFPLKGVDVSKGFGAQQPGTTPVGRNVRGYEPASKRAKGGGRPGLAKYLAAQLPSGAHLIQNLNIVDPSNDAALLSNVLDWPGLPFGGVGDPSIPSVPLPPPAPISVPAFGDFPAFAWTLDPTTPGLGPGHTATVQIQNPQPGQPSSVTVAVPSDWGGTTVGEGINSRNPGRIIPVGGSGAQPTKNKAKKLTPTIVWANPANVPVGTPLSSTQLNAVARDPNTNAVLVGTYFYSPGLGTPTTSSHMPLHVLFTPDDLAHYTINTAAALISSSQILFVQANQHGFTQGDPTPRTLAFVANVTKDNLLVVFVSNFATGSTGPPTDSLGNAWTALSLTGADGTYRLYGWYASANATGPCTVSVPNATLDYMGLGVLEYSGLVVPVVVEGVAVGNPTSPGASASLTTTTPVTCTSYGLLLGACTQGDAVVVWGQDPQFLLRVNQTDGNADMALYAADLIGALVTQPLTGVFPGPHAWAAIGVVFKGV